jgi:type IV secretory pathway TrbL component
MRTFLIAGGAVVLVAAAVLVGMQIGQETASEPDSLQGAVGQAAEEAADTLEDAADSLESAADSAASPQ